MRAGSRIRFGRRADELGAIFGEEPFARVEHLVHQHPAADAIVVGGDGAREAGGDEDVSHLLGDGGFVGAAGEGVGRKVDGVDFFGGGGGSVAFGSIEERSFDCVPRRAHTARREKGAGLRSG